jgi:hypothetical protein
MAVFPIKGTLGIIAFKRGIGEISISRASRRFVSRGEEIHKGLLGEEEREGRKRRDVSGFGKIK